MAKVTSIGEEVAKKIDKECEENIKRNTARLLEMRGYSQKEIDYYFKTHDMAVTEEKAKEISKSWRECDFSEEEYIKNLSPKERKSMFARKPQ